MELDFQKVLLDVKKSYIVSRNKKHKCQRKVFISTLTMRKFEITYMKDNRHLVSSVKLDTSTVSLWYLQPFLT